MGAFPGSQNPSLDDLVSKTIRKNLGDPSCVGDPNTDPIPNGSNPVPKPPRRGTNNGLTAGTSSSPLTATSAPIPNNYTLNESCIDELFYENLQRYHGGTAAVAIDNKSGPLDPAIYAPASDVVIGRPVPPVPTDDCDDEFRKNNTSLTEDELNQLYATVDVVKRNAERMLKKTKVEDSKREEFKVSTVVDGNGMVKEGIFKVKVNVAL